MEIVSSGVLDTGLCHALLRIHGTPVHTRAHACAPHFIHVHTHTLIYGTRRSVDEAMGAHTDTLVLWVLLKWSLYTLIEAESRKLVPLKWREIKRITVPVIDTGTRTLNHEQPRTANHLSLWGNIDRFHRWDTPFSLPPSLSLSFTRTLFLSFSIFFYPFPPFSLCHLFSLSLFLSRCLDLPPWDSIFTDHRTPRTIPRKGRRVAMEISWIYSDSGVSG